MARPKSGFCPSSEISARAPFLFRLLLPLVLTLQVGCAAASSEDIDESSVGAAAARSEQPMMAENWPATVAAAAADILAALTEKDIEKLRETPKDDLILFHHGWGTGIRNQYGLWKGNTALLRDACGGEECHPDDASMVIVEAVWIAANRRRDER